MTQATDLAEIESQIGQWRQYLHRRRAIHGTDVEELESHLRDEIGALMQSGLTGDEAFLVAVKRLGGLDSLSREFANEHSERLWKQLVIGPETGAKASAMRDTRREFRVAAALAFAAALAIKLPSLFGIPFDEPHAWFYARNAALFVLPLLAGYFAWKRRLPAREGRWLAAAFAAGAVIVNAYPYPHAGRGSQTEWLAAMHLPIALWLVIGIAYAGGHWASARRRMDFVRFSGELFIYFVLIGLGGFVFTAFTLVTFGAIGIRADWLAQQWLVPCGAAGALIVASWLVEAKQSVIENMAPVLTRLFTPLFTVLLLVFLATMAWTGRPIDVQRNVLIAFDLLLAMVVALVLYSVSARDPAAPPDLFDRLQGMLVASALVADLLALTAIAMRISEFGFTPNRVAALGENLILLVNLAGTMHWHLRFLRARCTFNRLESWQTGYLPVYSAWAALVVALFPPLFHFS